MINIILQDKIIKKIYKRDKNIIFFVIKRKGCLFHFKNFVGRIINLNLFNLVQLIN